MSVYSSLSLEGSTRIERVGVGGRLREPGKSAGRWGGGGGGGNGRGRETFYKDYLLVLLLLSCFESLYPSLAPSVEVVEGRQFF